MAAHNELGKEGEDMAATWLAGIEVKTRKGNESTRPESSVNKQKFRSIKWAANAYLRQNPGNPWIQYDILAITIKQWGETEYFLLEDVYL